MGNVIWLAAHKALEEWQYETKPAIGEGRWTAPPTSSPDPGTGACRENISYSCTALAVLVNLDQDTGQVDVEKVFLVQDGGEAFPELYDLESLEPTPEWTGIYEGVKAELSSLGLDLENGGKKALSYRKKTAT